MSTPETVWRIRWGWLYSGKLIEWVEYRTSKELADVSAEQKRCVGYDVVVEEFFLISKEHEKCGNQEGPA